MVVVDDCDYGKLAFFSSHVKSWSLPDYALWFSCLLLPDWSCHSVLAASSPFVCNLVLAPVQQDTWLLTVHYWQHSWYLLLTLLNAAVNRLGKIVKIWKMTQSCEVGARAAEGWVGRGKGTLLQAAAEVEEVGMTGSQTRGLLGTASLVESLAWAD